MKKSTKIGLVGSIAYIGLSCTTLAIADTPNQYSNLTNTELTTTRQAFKAYNEQIRIYAKDKKLTPEEISSLADILKTKRELLLNRHIGTIQEISNLESAWERMNDELWNTKKKIKGLESKKVYNTHGLGEIKKDLDAKVLAYYPYLIEKPTFYSASDPIDEKQSLFMKELVQKTNKLLKEHYNDDTLELLIEKKAYTVRDLATFYKVIHKTREPICLNCEEIEQIHKKLGEEFVNLKKNFVKQTREKDMKINRLRKNRYWISEEIGRTVEVQKLFREYLTSLEKFMNDPLQDRKYLAVSLWELGIRNETNNVTKIAAESIEKYFSNLTFDVHVKHPEKPLKTMLPWPWWCTTIFGAAFPIFRNFFTAEFIRREADAFDAGEGLFLEPILFSIFLDSMFPLMYPLRLFGMPILLEPLRKATGLRTLK